MSDTGVIAIVVGVVAIVLLVLFRQRLTRFRFDVRKGRVDADMNRDEPLPPGGVRQRDVEAKGNVTARDAAGVGASLESVKSGSDTHMVITASHGTGVSRIGEQDTNEDLTLLEEEKRWLSEMETASVDIGHRIRSLETEQERLARIQLNATVAQAVLGVCAAVAGLTGLPIIAAALGAAIGAFGGARMVRWSAEGARIRAKASRLAELRVVEQSLLMEMRPLRLALKAPSEVTRGTLSARAASAEVDRVRDEPKEESDAAAVSE